VYLRHPSSFIYGPGTNNVTYINQSTVSERLEDIVRDGPRQEFGLFRGLQLQIYSGRLFLVASFSVSCRLVLEISVPLDRYLSAG
jgi:hypothetical protein